MNDNERLAAYGWNAHWSEAYDASRPTAAETEPARVTAQYSDLYEVMTNEGERQAVVSGKFRYAAASRADYPAVGDWIVFGRQPGGGRGIIHAVLPRRSGMTRREAGSIPDEQVIAANLDTIFIVSALNQDFNLRKLERYLIAAWESGASPVVLLTKADLCEEPERYASQAASAAPGVPVLVVSAVAGIGKELVEPFLHPGRTVGVTGSSGVGKSTLLNWLSGADLQRVQAIREDDARGRHTTTHRQLFPLPGGALLIDTPGMRELQLWDSASGLEAAFADIAALAAQCRFHDCRHESEAGCAIRNALAEGTLDHGRYANYVKTQKELAYMARKDARAVRKPGDRKRPSRSAGKIRAWQVESED